MTQSCCTPGTPAAEPILWLGAPSPGALILPAANPTPSHLYGPRGVWIGDHCLIAADTGNHRLLIWRSEPDELRDGQAADVVLGQPDFLSEGPNAGGRSLERGLYMPTGVMVVGGRLYVADSWNHRVVWWEQIPERSFTPPDGVIGQPDLRSNAVNRNCQPSATSLYWPYGIGWVNDTFYIADTGNRRVLGWNHLPSSEQPASLVLGQPTLQDNRENRGGAPAADSFRWPHAIAGGSTLLLLADGGNHRVLGWSPPPLRDQPASLVLGQPDFLCTDEFPYVASGAQRLRFPYGVSGDERLLAVADTANNRILLWRDLPASGAFLAASAVLGQEDFTGFGENRWQAVRHDTFCWPYGIHLHRHWLAVADSGNNRVMVWKVNIE